MFTGSKIEHVTERLEQIMGRGKGGTILVDVGTNNADKEGTTTIVDKYRNPKKLELDKSSCQESYQCLVT